MRVLHELLFWALFIFKCRRVGRITAPGNDWCAKFDIVYAKYTVFLMSRTSLKIQIFSKQISRKRGCSHPITRWLMYVSGLGLYPSLQFTLAIYTLPASRQRYGKEGSICRPLAFCLNSSWLGFSAWYRMDWRGWGPAGGRQGGMQSNGKVMNSRARQKAVTQRLAFHLHDSHTSKGKWGDRKGRA